jgi:hypothetical protein
MSLKEDVLGIAAALADAEQAAPSEQLTTLHDKLRRGLYKHRDTLGLSADDVAEIDNFGPQARGGGPKNPPQQV